MVKPKRLPEGIYADTIVMTMARISLSGGVAYVGAPFDSDQHKANPEEVAFVRQYVKGLRSKAKQIDLWIKAAVKMGVCK